MKTEEQDRNQFVTTFAKVLVDTARERDTMGDEQINLKQKIANRDVNIEQLRDNVGFAQDKLKEACDQVVLHKALENENTYRGQEIERLNKRLGQLTDQLVREQKKEDETDNNTLNRRDRDELNSLHDVIKRIKKAVPDKYIDPNHHSYKNYHGDKAFKKQLSNSKAFIEIVNTLESWL